MTEKFVATGKFDVPQGPETVYLEWLTTSDRRGEMIPGRLLPPTIEYKDRTYQFDGMEATRARYTRMSAKTRIADGIGLDPPGASEQ